jgi:predicted DNA-binding transcriptional regulator AlpA
VAIANTFLRESLQYTVGSRITSRDLLNRHTEWCELHRLFRPPAQAVALAMRSSGYLLLKTGGRHVWCNVAWREQPDPFLTLAEPDVLRRITESNPVMRLRVFLRLVGIGRSTFYQQVSTGNAPRYYKRGRLCFITVEDALAWCVSRSRHASILAIMDWVQERRASFDGTSRREMDLLWTKAR